MASKISVEAAIRKAVKIFNGEPASRFPANVPITANNETLKSINAAGTGFVDMMSVGADDQVRLVGEVVKPFRQSVTLTVPLNAGMVDQCVFIVPYAMKVVGIQEIHATAGDDAGAVTINLTKDTATTAPGAGTTIMSGTFNAKGTANVLQSATLTGTAADLTLAAGDRIGVNFTGTIATLAGLVITLIVEPGGKGGWAIYRSVTGGIADQCFYVANLPRKVAAIYYVHSTKGTDNGAVNVQVTKDTTTNAPGAGTDLLTNNTNAGFDCKGANNTVQTGTLTATEANLWLAPGDRLSVDFAGVTTALAGAVVVVVFEQHYERMKEVSLIGTANADCVDRCFFLADRTYYVRDARYVNATAGTDGGAVTMQLTVDKLTDAPGAGTDILSNNTNAGFSCKTTASTVVLGTFISEGLRCIPPGHRLSADFAGTTTSLAGAVCTVLLEAV